jgi:glycine/D-amino acid oxidase-like deaminating enzyme
MPTTLDAYDTVIVGGGLAGAIVACRLAAASQKVVLLEAQEAIGGAAPRGAGLALLGTPEPYTALQTRLGNDGARQVWELTRENLALLSHALETAGLDVQRTGSLRLTNDAQEATHFQRSAALLPTLGYSVTLADPTKQGQLAALHTQDDIGYDPAALIAALLDHPNITVENAVEVQAIKPQLSEAAEPLLTIWARKHYLWARAVVLTAGAHTVRLSAALRPWLHPTRFYSMELVTDTPRPVPLIMAGGKLSC